MQQMTLGLSALVLMFAGTALAAQDHLPPPPETRAQAQARAARLFDRLDLNHDGVISRDEAAAADEQGADHHDDGGHDDGGHGHPDIGHQDNGHPDIGHHDHHRMEMAILQRADPAHTGTVTRDAFVAAALALFDQADTDHDGVLTPDERRAAAAAMRAQFAQHGGPPPSSPGN